jgi:leader peptidase (prepilin peptidase)/N-methyltransferase
MPVGFSRPVLLGVVLVVAVVVGPWLARIAVRLAARDDTAVPSTARIGVMTTLLAGLLAGTVELTGLRPATLAVAWAAGAAVVLGAVDLASHRLPDRVTFPAYAVLTPRCWARGRRWSGLSSPGERSSPSRSPSPRSRPRLSVSGT